MNRPQLKAQPREITGKKVKALRREGVLPANVYGPRVESLAVQLPRVDFQKTLREAGETELIDLQVEGEDEPRPVLVSEVQLDPVRDLPLHADFFQVDLSKKVIVDVPLAFVNAEKASKLGVLLELLSEVEVEVLPNQIPSEIGVDLAVLQAIGDSISVDDLEVPKGVDVLTEADELVARLNPLEETLEEEVEREKAKEADESEGSTEPAPAES